jgi:protein phosphatase
MKMNITASSRVGCVRSNNEDMILVSELLIRNGKMSRQVDSNDSDRYIIALADGMGGHSCGEVASAETLGNLKYYYSDLPKGLSPGDFNEAMNEWLISINYILEAKGVDDASCRGMGTTLVALAYYEKRFFWINCGDSRLYRLHDNKLQQMTTDHSLSNLMGVAEKHSPLITNCIGGGCKSSYIDLVECTKMVEPGDAFMLCSDGLTDMVDDQEIERLMVKGFDADALCQAAEDAGGRDNVSVILIRVE